MLRTPFDLCELAAPGVAIPDLEVVVDSRDDDVALELRVLQERGRQSDASLLVQFRLRCAGEEEALHPAALLAQRVQRGEASPHERGPVVAGVRVQAAVDAARHDDSLRERLPEAGRQREAVLVVQCVLVLAEKHPGALPLCPTLPHHKPHRPTCLLLRKGYTLPSACGTTGREGTPAWRRRPGSSRSTSCAFRSTRRLPARTSSSSAAGHCRGSNGRTSTSAAGRPTTAGASTGPSRRRCATGGSTTSSRSTSRSGGSRPSSAARRTGRCRPQSWTRKRSSRSSSRSRSTASRRFSSPAASSSG